MMMKARLKLSIRRAAQAGKKFFFAGDVRGAGLRVDRPEGPGWRWPRLGEPA
jgi:hypothetical protein